MIRDKREREEEREREGERKKSPSDMSRGHPQGPVSIIHLYQNRV